MEISNQDYKEMNDNSNSYYRERINHASNRAYEYGVLVVKNAFLVSGGGIFLTPALIQLVDSPNLILAAYAGALFAGALLLALIANYMIHISWLLHESVWDNCWLQNQIQLRKIARRELEGDIKENEELKETIVRQIKWIKRTFYLVHFSSLLFVLLFIAACAQLYRAIGIVN
jgi:cell division protein FtsB